MKKKESGTKTYDSIVTQILRNRPKLKKDRKGFSDYIIETFVTDFMYDPKIKGEHETRKSKAKDIYLAMMAAWEKQFDKEMEKKE